MVDLAETIDRIFISKWLRGYFRFDRRLLKELLKVVWSGLFLNFRICYAELFFEAL